jgi:hypothetical protein
LDNLLICADNNVQIVASLAILLSRVERMAKMITSVPLETLINTPFAADIMKELNSLLESQKELPIFNSPMIEIVSQLILEFAPVCRLSEALVNPYAPRIIFFII